MATHSNILAWRSLWTEEPVGLQSMGFAESDMTEVTDTFTSLLLFTLIIFCAERWMPR